MVSESQTTQEQLTSKEISDFLNRIAEFTEALKLPHTIFISDLKHDKYKLTQPIPVSIEYENNVVIASFYDVDVYGTGDDIQEAITDLCSQIVEVYELYSQNVNHLGPVPAREVMQRDKKYTKTVKPIVMQNLHGVEIISGNEINRIYFNPYGSHFEIDGVASDGEKVVIREKDSEIVSWAVIRGQKLTHNGRELPNEVNH